MCAGGHCVANAAVTQAAVVKKQQAARLKPGVNMADKNDKRTVPGLNVMFAPFNSLHRLMVLFGGSNGNGSGGRRRSPNAITPKVRPGPTPRQRPLTRPPGVPSPVRLNGPATPAAAFGTRGTGRPKPDERNVSGTVQTDWKISAAPTTTNRAVMELITKPSIVQQQTVTTYKNGGQNADYSGWIPIRLITNSSGNQVVQITDVWRNEQYKLVIYSDDWPSTIHFQVNSAMNWTTYCSVVMIMRIAILRTPNTTYRKFRSSLPI